MARSCPAVSSAGMAAALTITQLFDSLAIRIDGKRAWDTTASIRWHFSDTRRDLSDGAVQRRPHSSPDHADPTRRPRGHPHQAAAAGMLGGAGTDGVQLDGDPKTFATIAGFTDQPDPSFAIVTP